MQAASNKLVSVADSIAKWNNRKREMMERIKPNYYDRFTCIADKCTFTCCQEWKIAVDNETNRKWKKKYPLQEVKVQRKNLSAYTTKKDGGRVIRLDEEHKCPFLSENRLCRLVSAYGDSVLSETCTVFPREVHRFETHEEEVLMPCCPAVINLWAEEENVVFPEVPENGRNLRTMIREKMMEMFRNKEQSIEETLLESFYILLELYQAEQEDTLSEERIENYFSREAAKELKTAILAIDLPFLDTMDECNELLQDLAVNYQKEGLYQDYLTQILPLAEQLSETYDADEMEQKGQDFAKQWEKYRKLLAVFMENELFSDLLMPDGDLESMVIQMQWIAMEYTMIRHSLFLKWMQDGCRDLAYETLRDYLVLITRMTGYEEDDIYEYLENSFDELVWEWGYLSLIVGK